MGWRSQAIFSLTYEQELGVDPGDPVALHRMYFSDLLLATRNATSPHAPAQHQMIGSILDATVLAEGTE